VNSLRLLRISSSCCSSFILSARILFSFLISLFLSPLCSCVSTAIISSSHQTIPLFVVVRSLRTAYSATARYRYGSRGKIETMRRKRGREGGGSYSVRFSPRHVTDWYTSRDNRDAELRRGLAHDFFATELCETTRSLARYPMKWRRPNCEEMKNDVSKPYFNFNACARARIIILLMLK